MSILLKNSQALNIPIGVDPEEELDPEENEGESFGFRITWPGEYKFPLN